MHKQPQKLLCRLGMHAYGNLYTCVSRTLDKGIQSRYGLPGTVVLRQTCTHCQKSSEHTYIDFTQNHPLVRYQSDTTI